VKTSPTQRALAECKRRGWTAQVVERWNPYAKVRQDLFGVIDIVALTPDGIVGIQATGGQGGNHAARVAKIAAEPKAQLWKAAGGKLVVWSWALRGARGEAKVWTMREENV
jgi:hypothetical protein